MKKSLQRFLLLFMAIVMSSSGAWAAGTATAVLPTLPESAFNASEQTDFTADANGNVVFAPVYLFYGSGDLAKNQKWGKTSDASASTTGTTWTAPDGSVFKGSDAYPNYARKLNVRNTARTWAFRFTGATAVSALGAGNSSTQPLYMDVYNVADGAKGDLVKSVTNSDNATDPATVITVDGLDKAKEYVVYFYAEKDNNASLFEMSFATAEQTSGGETETNVWEDIKIDLTNAALLTTEEAVPGTALSLGVAVKGGAISRVETTDPSCDIVLSGKFHSTQHGWQNFSATVAVEGPVRISMGTCAWGGDVTVKDASGNTVATFNTNNGACYSSGSETNIASAIYKGEATTLTISGGSYTPYIAVEAVDPSTLVETNTATFSLGDYADCGVAPEAISADQNTEITIPGNYTMYKEGYTLTGWNDGTSTIALGAKYTLTDNVTLTPVFTENTKTLADRTEAVTLKWNFRKDQGAPVIAVEGASNGIGVWVTQANVAGETIDVKMDYDATSGKINNANNTDWAQVNDGTTFTIPSAKGAAVSMEAYYQFKRDGKTATTIDGQSDYTAANTVSYTIAGSAETIDIVVGSDAGYLRYIQTVLPVVEQGGEGGKTYTDEAASVVFAMSDKDTPGAYTATPDEGFSTVAFDYAACTISGTTSISITGETTGEVKGGVSSGVTGIKFKVSDVNPLLTWLVKPAKGLTFTPTKLKGYINRCGTNAEKGVIISAYKHDGSPIELGKYTAWRQNYTNSGQSYDSEAVYYYEIELTADQQAQLAGEDGFYLTATVGVGSTKEGAFGEVTISGKLNGTVAAVNKYTLGVEASPAEGGSVSAYPNSEEYIEDDEVTLTATENFGYDFVNWTDADGNVLSTEPKVKHTVKANAVLTANFKNVNTYALDVTVEGGANDYMVTLAPAPTVIDGKNMYEEGTKVTLTAASNKILTFNNWSNGETTAEMAVTMNEDKAFTATYSAKDFIAAWDFYKRGNSSRAADFCAADNDAVSLEMIDEAGNNKSWLDKSQEAAGGYEGRPAAVCWVTGNAEGDVGHHHWQTCVNASAFTDIKVITSMVYNYNAYPVQKVEYSLNGETWTTLGSITIEGAKKWTDATFSLPAEANNKEKVYIRWISDKTSKVAGAASKNDGIALGATYIVGTAKLVDDGKAPALVSSVPADAATGASANGKIVITFDEKVKLTENAKATLSKYAETEYAVMTRATADEAMELPIAVSGKTVTCEYKGLDYSTAYTFKLAAGSVSDLTGNVIDSDIVISFTTKVKPSVTKALYDFVVPADGTITQALAAANARGAYATDRYRIFITDGKYVFDTNGTTTGGDGKTYPDPRSYLTSPYVSFIGQSMEGVEITNITPDATWDNGYGTACPLEGIGKGDVLIIQKGGHDAYFQNLTMKSSMGDAHGRDIVLNDQSNRTIFKDACLWGYQDTYVSNNEKGKFYFEGGVIRGRTDYLCGKGDVFYNEVTLQQCGTGGYLAVPSIPKKYGYVFQNCYIKKETSDVTFWLGRPWGSGTPIACYINTKMDGNALGNGWADMGNGWPKRFAEYNSYLTSGTQIDLSGRRKEWSVYLTEEDKKNDKKTTFKNDPILTIDDVQSMSLANVMGQEDDWDPTALTEQASAPVNVVVNKDTKVLSWDDSNYVLGWVVFKNGVYAANVIAPTYTVDDATATWTVRAANEMGGLGEPTTATVTTAIENVESAEADADAPAYNVAGMRVNANAKGIIIRNGKKYVVK